ncbi:23S ribosomal RNA methyltransferase Erm [Paenibacillus alkalitolerans]|uniref:23S ribosomal RNA methyltransferase Erm n=1 Tax=Paenibacillus alkalitolerans TaxID=2799335 RepID=UPI0018F37DF5|nr:rRNA adenine N(6)-methyltransferase family protein [Paenibacillus alkalitolerans]
MKKQYKRCLKREGSRASGQPNFSGKHFLHDKRVVREMIRHAGIRPTDTVLDLGAGKGFITFSLARKAGKVLAVENDPALAAILRVKSEEHPNVTVIEKNLLEIRLPKEPFCVVSNIPFAITTPILEKLLDPTCHGFQSAVLILEKGAAKRFTDNPVKNPRILVWRMAFRLELVAPVYRDRFSPPPSVEAAVFSVKRRKVSIIEPRQLYRFAALAGYSLKVPELPVHAAFAGIFTPPQMKRLFGSLGIHRNKPVCTLNENQWGVVFHTMIERVEPVRWPRQARGK